jgi:hypothetical protein
VTVSDKVAASSVGMSSSCAASAAAKHEEDKDAEISRTHHFVSIAFETFGRINHVGTDFISSLGQRLALITDDPRESSFLFRRLIFAVQRFNGVQPIRLHARSIFWPAETHLSINLISFQ